MTISNRACSLFVCLAVLVIAHGADVQILRPLLKPETHYAYKVTTVETDYSGAGMQQSGRYETATPVQVSVLRSHGSGADLQVISGPLIVRGRSVGRSKVLHKRVDAGNTVIGAAPSVLAVPMPVGGVRVGQSWRSGISGPAPVAAGLQATYRLVRIVGDGTGRFAQVDFSLDAYAASKIRGSGHLFLRLRDGYLDHGKARFDISYLRPNLKNRKQFEVNSHLSLDCTVRPI